MNRVNVPSHLQSFENIVLIKVLHLRDMMIVQVDLTSQLDKL